MTRSHRCLPDLSFITFAITRESEHSIVLTIQSCSESHSVSDREPLPERSCRDVNPRSDSCRMPLQYAPSLPKREKRCVIEVSGMRQCCIQSGSCVALTEHQPVAI